MKSYVVVGMGRFGSEVARQLYASGCDVLAIDTDETMIQQISNDVTQAVVANAQDTKFNLFHNLAPFVGFSYKVQGMR